MHYSVLHAESLEYLALDPAGTYVDATAGLGGHTRLIAERLTTGKLYACDRDAESLAMARQNTAEFADRIEFVQSSFSTLKRSLESLGVPKVHGLLADLGVSRYQLTDPERGFSFMAEGPIDMRMDRSQPTTAGDLVNYQSEKDLADLIYQLGEERRARRIARAIVRARPIRSTAHLAQVIEAAVPRTGRLHPATQTFMALRLAVNDEPGELDALLEQGPELIQPGGRLVVISFMSLEDRKVKQRFQALARGGKATVLTKHVVVPSEAEVRENPASRSAKLRALEMR
ncbi:MAG TPA: 16S rRNA (cytosine(1402)-N(4))-methyltransferase RsmH [Bryobacteraceae bacterium]|nr:16S rRNA (cytosine(1402)-N(4))-methyltransferase RsmH [Bryobacteraceae bacterium]